MKFRLFWQSARDGLLPRLRRPLRFFALLVATGLVLLGILWLAFWLGAGLVTFVASSLVGTDPYEVSRFVARSAGIGFMVMALIQLVRSLFRIRGRFHRAAVRRWLLRGIERHRQRDDHRSTARGTEPKPPDDEAVDRLVRLATTHDDTLLFDLPIEQLCGQISAAADRALDDPADHKYLLLGLAGEAGVADAREYPRLWEQNRRSKRPSEAFLDARAGLTHHIQRNIDGLQIAAGMTWRRRLRWCAVGLAFVFAAAFSVAQTAKPPATAIDVNWVTELRRLANGTAKSLFTAVAAGFLATFFRDVVAAVEKLRR